MIRRARRFFALPRDERRMTVEAALALTVVSAALKALPFAMAMRAFGLRVGQAALKRAADPAQARKIGRAVARAARRLPFKPVCLPQAVAAALMLRRRGLAAEVRFGVAKRNGAVTAHAWSLCGDVPATGAEGAADFAPITSYTA